jgi:putative transposase
MMLIRKAYRYRLYPNTTQSESLARNFGCARFLYNYFLAERKRYYAEHKADQEKQGLSYFDTTSQLKNLKRAPEYGWLKEAHSQVLQQSLKDLDLAYQNFFAKRTAFPQFHKKSGRQSIRYPQGVQVGETWLSLPKIGKVRAVIHRPCEGKIKNVTVTKTKSGRFFASVQVELEVPEPAPSVASAVGVDVGLKSFLVTSDGDSIPAPRYLRKAQKRLARLQRRLSRRQPGSAGREKARKHVARQHERVANQRNDFLHQTSHWLVKGYGLIGIEDLNVKGMVRNHRLARAISDAGWGELRRQLVYKGAWYGTQVMVIDRFYPSSRTCCVCGRVLPELPLAVRVWNCPNCGTQHDRDLNAAMNLKNQASSRVGTTRINAGGEDVSPLESAAVLAEAGCRLL